MSHIIHPEHSELGKKSEYEASYNPDKLFPIPRKAKRDEIAMPEMLPFVGFDLWNHYEVSWLNEKGKPMVAVAEIIYGCDTPNMIESKSMKLYFNTLNNTTFKDTNTLQAIIENDISLRVGGDVTITLKTLSQAKNDMPLIALQGVCLDHLDVECDTYHIASHYLTTENEVVTETLYSDLLKSNCLVTNQPDWGSVQISYQGQKINHEGLLRYIISFRNHNEFHEQCIERIFMDIMRQCQPQSLSVYGRYTRRGGLDINPYRATRNAKHNVKNFRLCRQ